MARPDIKSSVIDKEDGDDAAAGAGGDDEPKDPAASASDDALNEPGDGADADGRGEDPAAGEDAGAEESAAGAQDRDPEPGSDDEQPNLDQMRERLRHELRADVLAEIKKEQEANAPAPAPKEISDEEWAKHEESWGIPRKAITSVVSRMERVVGHLMQKMDERFAKFEKNDALNALSQEKGFQDAKRYSKDVDEFLSHYTPKHHANPEILKRAVIFARGKNVDKTVDRARNDSERNRRIGGPARPAAGGSPNKNGVSRPLTAIERSAARAAGMSDGEYQKLRGASKVLN